MAARSSANDRRYIDADASNHGVRRRDHNYAESIMKLMEAQREDWEED